MMPRILYVTNREIGLLQDGGLTPLPSQRIAQYERVSKQLEERHEWKSSGQGAQFMNKRNPFAGASGWSGRITAIAPLNARELLYSAVFPESGGIYWKNYAEPDAAEGVIQGDMGLFVRDMQVRGNRVVFAADGARGQRHIGTLELNKPGYAYITEGDTQDSGPCLSADGQWVYYTSAGYARSEEGALLQTGPMALLRVHLGTMALEELEASDAFDYLRPKPAADGSLYYIKRPYADGRSRSGLKDTLLMPVHFVVGFVRFFAMFGKLFSNAAQPPDSPSSGPVKAKGRTEEEITLEGARVRISKALRENERLGDPHPGIVPRSWELIRQAPGGEKTVVRCGVLDYDLTEDGRVVLTNGRHILLLDAAGKETLLAKQEMALRVAVAPGE